MSTSLITTSYCAINHLWSGNFVIIYGILYITRVQAESITAPGKGGDSNDYDQLSIEKLVYNLHVTYDFRPGKLGFGPIAEAQRRPSSLQV